MNEELQYAIALSYVSGIGPIRHQALYTYFKSNKAIFEAQENELKSTGLSQAIIDTLIATRKSYSFDKTLTKLQQRSIWVIDKFDSDYPSSLLHIPSAPFLLFGIGNIELLHNEQMIAVVGTRKPTVYGRSVTGFLTKDLVSTGWTILSGMALGIDGIAHTAALENSGSTIAVLGSGVDICYPPAHQQLYERLCREGLVLSEYPPGMMTSRGVFPSRNRIVAGIAKAVLVTEGTKNSGSLITAQYAIEFNKDIFAVPGQITQSESEATFYLLKNGAKPVSRIGDINEEYSLNRVSNRAALTSAMLESLTEDEKKIVELLQGESPLSHDDISRKASIAVSKLLTIVTQLSLKGLVKEVGNHQYEIYYH